MASQRRKDPRMSTVLIVEDTELLRRMYADSLMKDGYDVITATDGLDAMEALRTERPDLILLDLIMPNMGGLEALARVKADPNLRHIPVLILSNLGQDEDIQKALEIGAADYMIKNDVRPADISLRINTLLRAAQDVQSAPSYRLYVRDHEGDADRLTVDARLTRHFWCPACEVELQIVLVGTDKPGTYESHIECPSCRRVF